VGACHLRDLRTTHLSWDHQRLGGNPGEPPAGLPASYRCCTWQVLPALAPNMCSKCSVKNNKCCMQVFVPGKCYLHLHWHLVGAPNVVSRMISVACRCFAQPQCLEVPGRAYLPYIVYHIIQKYNCSLLCSMYYILCSMN